MAYFYSLFGCALVVPLCGLNGYEKTRHKGRALLVVGCVIYSSVDGAKIRFISAYLALFGILL